MNVPTTLKRNFIDSDVNNLTNSASILDCKNRDSNALIGYPNLTGPVLDRFQAGIIRLALSDCSRNGGQKQNPTKDGHFADNDLHALPPFCRSSGAARS